MTPRVVDVMNMHTPGSPTQQYDWLVSAINTNQCRGTLIMTVWCHNRIGPLPVGFVCLFSAKIQLLLSPGASLTISFLFCFTAFQHLYHLVITNKSFLQQVTSFPPAIMEENISTTQTDLFNNRLEALPKKLVAGTSIRMAMRLRKGQSREVRSVLPRGRNPFYP